MRNPSSPGNAGTELLFPEHTHKRAGRIWVRVLLILVLGLITLNGIWFLGVRPSLHQQAVTQVNRAWTMAEGATIQYLSIFPDGQRKNLLVNEKLLSNALNTYDTDSVQNWQVTVTPTNIRLSFTTCGQNCPVTVILNVSNLNKIQVTQVQVQGIFTLILSDNELMDLLNRNLQSFNSFVTISTITKITLLEHAIDIQLY